MPQIDLKKVQATEPFIAVALALIVPIIGNRSGVGWSWDSTDYVAAGRSLSRGFGSLDVIGDPMFVRPPGYPALISIGEFFNVKTNTTLLIINLLSAGFVAFFAYKLLQRTTSHITTILGTLFIVLSPSLLWQFTMAWSEPPFLAIEMGCLFVALVLKTHWKYPILLLLYVGLFFVRFVGPIFAIPIALITVFVDRPNVGWKKATIYNGLALCISFYPTWWWLQRNKDVSGTLTGTRTGGGGTLMQAFMNGLATLGTFFSAQPFDSVVYDKWNTYPFAAQLGLLLVALTIVITSTIILKRLVRREHAMPRPAALVLLMTLGVVVAYLFFSSYRFVYLEYGRLDTRMMVPILVPLVIAFAILVDSSVYKIRSAQIIAVAASVLLIIAQFAVTGRDALSFGRTSRHMATVAFRNQPLHVFARSLPDLTGLFSNAPQQLSGAVDAWPIFHQFQGESVRAIPCNHRYVIWYKDFPWQDNIPDTAPVLYDDALGTIYDLGLCSVDIDVVWP